MWKPIFEENARIKGWAGLTAILAVLFLSSCSALSPQADAIRSVVLDRGAAVADRVLEDAVLVICRVSTAGAVERRFGATAALAEARRTICKTDPDHKVFGPNGAS